MLMITSLRIENFRGIEKLKLNNLGQINVIAGKNNAGKSSVLEALSLFLAAFGGGQSVRSFLQEILIWRGWYGHQAIEDLFFTKAELAKIISVQKGTSWELVLKNEIAGLNTLPTLKVTLKQIDKEPPKLDTGVQIHHLVENSVLSSFLLSSKFDPSLNFEFITPLTLRKFGYVESLYSIAYEEKVVKKKHKNSQGGLSGS
ncbi:AAA family ATPase [Palaeococcus ferrophilus]|uniref:AAA family ATPase n=1 Tax=Palaeococcus ferrophilus TaxID=83868 RepID=UPI001FE0276F|nr:AAA family ATPase [Palaeococcus ferrophilus]